MAGITFMNVQFLWALFSIPIMIALHFFLLRFTKRRAVLFANFEALKRVTGGIVLSKNLTLLIMRLLIIFFLCFSAAGLTIWYAAPGSAFNYVIAIDASSSMLADDFDPNRLEVAKSEAIDFVSALDAEVNIGVVSFAGVTKVETTLDPDRSKVIEAIEGIKISGVGGTDISGAIFSAVNILLSEPDKSMSVILITDGQHTVGSPIEEGINYAVENSVNVHAIGIATEEGGKFELISLLSTLDEEGLTRITESTGGKFFKAGSATDMVAAFSEIVELSEQNKPVQLRLILLIAGILLLFGEWVLANSRFKALP
jgi:Ca-activated chloride channel family protein